VLAVVRKWSTRVSLAGVGIVLFALALTLYARANGVHCPECDQRWLGDAYDKWKTFFAFKDGVWDLGFGVCLLGTPLAQRRLPGVAGLLLGALGIPITPK
jgi:hypothetical protein